MKTAKYIKTLEGFNGEARLYHLSEPLEGYNWGYEEEENPRYDYVVVSAAHAMLSGPETYIFGATPEGAVMDWTELPGSFRGGWDHEVALNDAGYGVDPVQ